MPDDSEAQRALRALAESEERFRTLVEQATDGIFIADAQGRYLEVSAAGCAMLGYSRDEILGSSIVDLIAPEEASRVPPEVARLLGGDAVRSEWRFRRKDGSFFQGEVNARRLTDSRLLAVVRDVTERRRVEEALRESESRYRLIVENQTELVVKWLPDGTRTFVNESYCRYFGVREEECLGTSFFPLVVPEFRDGLRRTIAGLTPEAPEATEEHLSFVAGGGRSWQEWRSRGIFAADGSLIELLSTGRDITERKQAEEALRASEARLRTVVEGMPVLMDAFDENLTIVAWNQECERVSGYRAEEVVGNPRAIELFYPDPQYRERMLAAWQERDKDYRNWAWELTCKDGTVRTIEWSNVSGRLPIPGWASWGIGFDVTERLKLEEQLRQSQKLQAVGQLAGGVAHDFNNLLTIITGYTHFLLNALAESSHPMRGWVVGIADACERAALLTRQLLMFSRRAVLEPRVLDLNEVLRHTSALLRRIIGEDITLDTVLAPVLHAVRADPGQIEQVVMNLAVNARDAMPQGGHLTLTTRNASFAAGSGDAKLGDFVELSVGDTGCGMTPEVRARIFEPFFTTKEPGKGTGLGLATVYGIVDQSGGFVTVDSEVGIGTTVHVYLPAAHPVAVAAA